MDRREFLKKSMLLTAGALIGGSLFSETSAAKGAKQNGIPRKKKSIGLQLYSIGGDMSADAAQALRQISEMGYSTAETASYGDGKFYGRTPAEFRKMAEDLGIAVTGAHIARELDKNDLQDYCDYFNRVGEIANAAGLRFGYHNHSHEFNKIEGQVIEDYMIENTDPDKVFFELDVYWASKGGVNPSAYIQKYAGRFPLLHIKDVDIIGASETIDFESIFKAAYKQGLEEYYVEIEANSLPPMLCARKSAEYLNVSKFVK